MSTNLLLYWMSARKQGSWAQFRAAVEELHVVDADSETEPGVNDNSDQYALPVYQAVRLNLQRLAHAEFFAGAGDSDWRIAPPTLAIVSQPEACRGVVAGARSTRMFSRILDSADNDRIEVLSRCASPDVIRMSARDEMALTDTARAAGLLVQRDASTAILQCLPTVDDPSVRRPADFPVGRDWRIERFATKSLSWSLTTREDAERFGGLFRFSFGHQRMVFWRVKGQTWAVPGQVGKYIALKGRRRHVLNYDRLAREMRIPVACRPPFLIERGLVICSGLLPRLEPECGLLCYTDVPADSAGRAAALLQQGLRA